MTERKRREERERETDLFPQLSSAPLLNGLVRSLDGEYKRVTSSQGKEEDCGHGHTSTRGHRR